MCSRSIGLGVKHCIRYDNIKKQNGGILTFGRVETFKKFQNFKFLSKVLFLIFVPKITNKRGN